MLYGNNDLIDTSAIQPGEDPGAENGSTTPPPGPPPPAEIPEIDWSINADGSINAGATFDWGDDGSVFGSFNFDPSSINSITFGFSDGNTSGSATFGFDNQSLSQSYSQDFGNGMTGLFDVSVSSDGYSATASLNFIF